MRKTTQHRTAAAILADIANIPPFVPGTIRKGGVQRHRNKAGELIEYKAMPRLNCRIGGRRVDKRFHDSLWDTMKELTDNYRRFRALVAEFEETALHENIPEDAKKN